ncbi:hypothetical protein POM88_031280 [Heracleum sosnowskyi]|uniref:FBD domain-containing protein n=1 Tax=Heracleum sosnowskyi TaxID=360622 RepID=A0AAD8HZ19_9APIA|nr:hypothetical protein POM88_031280 [Heracleum sosnowskyi]
MICCPLLEKFACTNVADSLALAIHAPNLKHLTLNGFFTNLYLKHTPLLIVLSIDFFGRAWKSNVLVKVPVTYEYDCLKFIELQALSFDEMINVLDVLYLILRSPNVQELQIEATSFDDKAADLDFWENECPTNFTFKYLERVKMSGVSTGNCMELLKCLLGCSPVLKVMSVSPCDNCNGKMKMADEVLHYFVSSQILIVEEILTQKDEGFAHCGLYKTLIWMYYNITRSLFTSHSQTRE